ncbi:MAG: F0F1 ATP synthase subunit delta [Acidobacteriaceae bacterium]
MAGGVALRYAHAFASVAQAEKLDPNAAQQNMQDFADTLTESQELREFLMNPSIAMPQKIRVLDAIVARVGAGPQIRNFLAVVLEHQRLAELDAIRAQYRELVDEHAGAVEATITSARALDAQSRTELEAEAAKLVGATIRASYVVDPALLGGAIVQIGSTVYDGSVRAQLADIKQKLVNA